MSSTNAPRAFVRTSLVASQSPPLSGIGVLAWMRQRLFAGWLNTGLTIALLLLFFLAAPALARFSC